MACIENDKLHGAVPPSFLMTISDVPFSLSNLGSIIIYIPYNIDGIVIRYGKSDIAPFK